LSILVDAIEIKVNVIGVFIEKNNNKYIGHFTGILSLFMIE